MKPQQLTDKRIMTAILSILLLPAIINSAGASDHFIYWSDYGCDAIMGVRENEPEEFILVDNLPHPLGIFFDHQAMAIYWGDAVSDKIQRYDIENDLIEDVIIDVDIPNSVVLDSENGMVYWAESGPDGVYRASLDGSVREVLLIGLKAPNDLALDLEAGKMYFSQPGIGKIQRANLDGSNLEDVINSQWCQGIALDNENGKIYWTVNDLSSSSRIMRADLDGNNTEVLVSSGLLSPTSIALDLTGGKMYWSDQGTDSQRIKKIQRANLDGTGVEEIISFEEEDCEKPFRIVLVPAYPIQAEEKSWGKIKNIFRP